MIIHKPFPRLLPLLALVLATTACSLAGEPPVTYVIVTSALDVSVAQLPTDTPQPSPTPEPTFTPTPDVAPDVGLRSAERLLLDGYFEDAVTTYQQVINRGDSTDEQRAAAAFGSGQAALRAGLFDQAVNVLTVLVTDYPNDYRAPQGYFLRGDAYMGLSNWAAAIADFQRYLQLRPGVIDSYAQERIGDAHLALGQQSEALTSYELATQANRSLVPALALREKVAQIYLNSGNRPGAIAQYDAILGVAVNAPYRASIEFTAAKTLVDAGDLTNGIARMQRIFNTYTETPQALQAMQILLQNGRTLDTYQQGKVYYANQDYQNAIVAFNTYSSETELVKIDPNVYLLLGRAYREVGNAAAALVAFDTIVKQYPTDPLLGEALLEQGRTRFLSGDTPGAIEFYLTIAANYSYLTDISSEALWRAGYLYSTTGQAAQARATFEQLAERYPRTSQAVSGLMIAADAALAAGTNDVAELLYSKVATLATVGTDKGNAFLQIGRLAKQRGDAANANAAFDQAIAAAPDSYISARAADLRGGIPPFQRPAGLQFEFDEMQQLTDAENWLRTTFNIPAEQASPLWVLSPELEADPRVIRGRELWLVGVNDAAETEFLDVLEQYKSDGLASYRLSLFLRGLGAYYPSQVGAANVITAAGISTLQAPPYIARLRYPTYYRDVVLRTSQQHGLDPLLLWALIRHESLFDTYATAAAGEKGLTQVIPSTADYIAQQLNWQDYQHADLFRPYAGIAFGAFYLDEQLDRFDGYVYPALAGYNAGPGRAITWLDLAGNDPDRYMATISIASTQLYIQRIYSHYAVYRALYGT